MTKSIKIILSIALTILMIGCSNNKNINTSKVLKPKIDKSLPYVDSKSIKFIPSINQIAIEWAGSIKANAHGYYIYRSNLQLDGEQLSRVAKLPNRYSSHYVDTNLKPSTQYMYSISIIGKNGMESIPSNLVKVNTLPIFNSISLIKAIGNLPRQVKLIWRPHTNFAVSSYIIERKSEKKPKWKKIITIKGRLNPEYIDTNLKDNTVYSYRIKSVTYDKIISKASPIVKARTKALPNSVSSIEATTNLPRKIILTWEEASQDDVIAYNIYSSDSQNGYFKKVATTNKNDNTFEDMINTDNQERFYKITTIDKDNLETDIKLLPVTMGKTLNKPSSPIIRLALIKDDAIILNWKKGDNRAISYNIYKTIKESFFKSKTKIFKNIKGLRFEDKDIVRGFQYIYNIEAVDKNGLVSPKVQAASLKMDNK